jgi:hypothetical protein
MIATLRSPRLGWTAGKVRVAIPVVDEAGIFPFVHTITATSFAWMFARQTYVKALRMTSQVPSAVLAAESSIAAGSAAG